MIHELLPNMIKVKSHQNTAGTQNDTTSPQAIRLKPTASSGKPASKLAGIDNSKLKIEGQEVFNKSSKEPSRCTFKPHTCSRFFVPTLCWSEKVLLFRKQWFQNADSIQISDVPQVFAKKPPKPGLQTKRCWCWYWLMLLVGVDTGWCC